jgi:hypothetical protein
MLIPADLRTGGPPTIGANEILAAHDMGTPFLVHEVRGDTFTVLGGGDKPQTKVSIDELLLEAYLLQPSFEQYL